MDKQKKLLNLEKVNTQLQLWSEKLWVNMLERTNKSTSRLINHKAFHKFWTSNVSTTNYDKKKWIKTQQKLMDDGFI